MDAMATSDIPPVKEVVQFSKTKNKRPAVRRIKHSNCMEEVSQILNIDITPDWWVFDRVGDLALVHYNEGQKCDLKNFGHYRGVIVDLSTKEIVRDTFNHMPECEQDSLVIEDGFLRMVPMQNDTESVKIPVTDITINKGHDGVVIDIWMDKDGVVHGSTLKKIDTEGSNSKFNNSLPFDEVFKQFGIPKEACFSSEYKRSPFVHSFLMVHPDFSIATKELIGGGYAVYLGYKKMSISGPAGSLEPEPVDIKTVLKNCTSKYNELNTDNDKERMIYLPANISVKAANHHLRYGYYSVWDDENVHPSLRTGEFLIITDKNTGKMYRVLSPAYYWRLLVRGRHQVRRSFFIWAHDANKIRKRVDYFKSGFYPHLTRQDINLIASVVNEGKPIIWLDQTTKYLDLNDYNDRLMNIWLCMLLAVPIHMQRDVIDAIEEYENLLLKGSNDAFKIARAGKNIYNDKESEIARNIAYLPFKIRKSSKKERERYVVNKLRIMEPEIAYRNIRLMEKEIKRVERPPRASRNLPLPLASEPNSLSTLQ